MVSLTDEGVLFAKNSDRDPNEAQVIEWVAAARHDPGETLRCTWIDVPQVAHTSAVVISRPWWMWGAEIGANEHGVVIGNEAVFTDRMGEAGGLLGMDLLRLGLERSTTRDEAVGTIVDLLERHGQGGSCSHEHPRFNYDNSFLVADPTGAVVLETAGRAWATEEVEGRGRSISNGLTIPGFAESHSEPVRSRVSACHARRGITQGRAASANLPADLFAVLRDHGPTAAPGYSLLNGAMSAPCMHAGGLVTESQTTASWVADLRTGGGRHWVTATAAPCTSLFKPIEVLEPVDLGPPATNRYDPEVGWWRHERLHRAVMADPDTLTRLFRPQRDEIEEAWLADPPNAEEAFEHARKVEDRWLEVVLAARSRDRRPLWARARWRTHDRRAGISRAA